MRARSKKEDHTAGESLSTTPFRFFESRTSNDPSATATSRQPPLLDAVLFRHLMDGSSKSITRTPLLAA